MNVRSFLGLFGENCVVDSYKTYRSDYRKVKSLKYNGDHIDITLYPYHEENHSVTLGELVSAFLHTNQEFVLIDQEVSFKTKGLGRMPLFLHLHKKYLDREIYQISVQASNPSVIEVTLGLDIEELFALMT